MQIRFAPYRAADAPAVAYPVTKGAAAAIELPGVDDAGRGTVRPSAARQRLAREARSVSAALPGAGRARARSRVRQGAAPV